MRRFKKVWYAIIRTLTLILTFGFGFKGFDMFDYILTTIFWILFLALSALIIYSAL